MFGALPREADHNLLSISYVSFFYLVFCFYLFFYLSAHLSWTIVSAKKRKKKKKVRIKKNQFQIDKKNIISFKYLSIHLCLGFLYSFKFVSSYLFINLLI